MNQNFDDIRPYNDNEIEAATHRIIEDNFFPIVVSYLFPGVDIEQFKTKISKIKTIREFQVEIMFDAIYSIVRRTSSGLISNGFEKLSKDKNYLFISNHRDIVLDSAIFQILCYDNGLETTEITFGDNLMINQFIIDVGKINRMFTFKRGGSLREIFVNSLESSNYMRYVLTGKRASVWIAQKNGRTKDGFDKTADAVLKMFSMSSKERFIENLNELCITPVAISYEYEPCDALKTQEIYVSRRQKYEKTENEDLNSILTGINQHKGGIAISICDTISKDDLIICNDLHNNKKFAKLAQIIDKRIYSNYKLWKTNYIAYDILYGSDIFADQYSLQDKFDFINYCDISLKNLNGDKNELLEIFLNIYVNPIRNKEINL
jgi:hypothetical protein